jgi:peptidylprolyl isomerase
MAQVKEGDTIKVHYTGKLSDGEVFDSSEGREPLTFTIGKGELIEGFESGVIGMEVGDRKTIEIAPAKGYGERSDELTAVVSREQIPSHIEVSDGQMLQIQQPDGQKINVVMRDITDDNVTLDANHPLAGKELFFDVEIVDIT